MTKISQFFLLILLALVPLSAMARGSDDISGSPDAQEKPTSQAEIEAFYRVAVSARDSIASVEHYLAGAKVVDISFDGSQAVPIYHIKACHRGQILSGSVDTSTRSVVISGSMPISKLDDEERSNIADTDNAGFDLSEAITIAEKFGTGKAVSAGLIRANGKPVFMVVVASHGDLKEVSVSPTHENMNRPRSPSRASAIVSACRG